MMTAVRQDMLRYFGDLLDYPTPELAGQARACAELLGPEHGEAASQLRDFAGYMERTPLGRMEEIYTGTFDMNPACYIFAGYILFGESFKRGKFLVRLQEEYRARGFSAGSELADHMAVLLRFMSLLDPGEETAQLLRDDVLLPVLAEMDRGFDSGNGSPNPYRQVLHAILAVLRETGQAVPA